MLFGCAAISVNAKTTCLNKCNVETAQSVLHGCIWCLTTKMLAVQNHS